MVLDVVELINNLIYIAVTSVEENRIAMCMVLQAAVRRGNRYQTYIKFKRTTLPRRYIYMSIFFTCMFQFILFYLIFVSISLSLSLSLSLKRFELKYVAARVGWCCCRNAIHKIVAVCARAIARRSGKFLTHIKI